MSKIKIEIEVDERTRMGLIIGGAYERDSLSKEQMAAKIIRAYVKHVEYNNERPKWMDEIQD